MDKLFHINGRSGSYYTKKDYIIKGSYACMIGDSREDYFVGVIIAGKIDNNEWDTEGWALTPRIFKKTAFRLIGEVEEIPHQAQMLPNGFKYKEL